MRRQNLQGVKLPEQGSEAASHEGWVGFEFYSSGLTLNSTELPPVLYTHVRYTSDKPTSSMLIYCYSHMKNDRT